MSRMTGPALALSCRVMVEAGAGAWGARNLTPVGLLLFFSVEVDRLRLMAAL